MKHQRQIPHCAGFVNRLIPDFALRPHPAAAEATNQLFADLVGKGLRAELASANLLTGQRVIELDFIPDAPPVQLVSTEPYPELPTVEGSSIEQITSSTNKLMDSSRPSRSTSWWIRYAA